MKYQISLILLVLAGSLLGQSRQSGYEYDLNGHPVPTSSVVTIQGASSAGRIETVQNMNGHSVPAQSVEQRVISDSGGVKVIERIVKKYDGDGRLSSTERVRSEEQLAADGTGTIKTTVMQNDVNGNAVPSERSNTEIRKSGNSVSSSSTVERPTLNGSFEQVERREQTVEKSGDGREMKTATVYQKDSNGRFGEARKEVVETTPTDANTTKKNSAIYSRDSSGQLQLERQTVEKDVKTATGVKSQIDVFEPVVPGGMYLATPGKPQLREQQLIERTNTPTGAVETLSIRRVEPRDATKLGPAQKIAETVCTGKCAN